MIGEAALKANDFCGREIINQNIIPGIVLQAFSCELFLKSLISPNALNTHKLQDIFELLSDEDKKDIKQKVISKMMCFVDDYSSSLFDKDLDRISNAFVDWRYFYEGKRTINKRFLDILFGVLWKKY